MKKIVEKDCKFCNKIFIADFKEVKRGNAIFCSRSCSSKYRNINFKKLKISNVFCAFCKKEFYKPKNKLKNSKSGLYFCCREHKDLAQRLNGVKEIQPKHYGLGNGKYNYRSLIIIKVCEVCGWNKKPEILQVHHKDRNKENNSIDNLQVLCPNCHLSDHFDQKDGPFHNKK